MISLLKICEHLNGLLNTEENINYLIYSEAELHKAPKRKGNSVKKVIEGIATIVSSSIVPIQGLKLGTQTIAVEFAVPIDTSEMIDVNKGIEEIIDKHKQDINEVVSEPKIIHNLDGYVVTMTGTLAEVGEIQQQSAIGLMAPISFTITLNYFENGLNSLNQKLKFQFTQDSETKKEDITFTSMSIARTVIQDGGAFFNTNGVSKNYVQTTALSIELTLPATNSEFCKKFREFIRTGKNDKLDIIYSDDNENESEQYKMIFLTSNLQAQGVDNVGYTITLAEAL